MAVSRAALRRTSIDVAALIEEVSAPDLGAVCVFVGNVRDRHEGRGVTRLDYDCYEPMAVAELERILAEVNDRHADLAIVAEHRLGSLSVGETAVAVVAAHERRGSAIAAMQFVIEELKRRLPIWKLEHYADGDRHWVGATSSAAVAQ
jgi:molybdopterin synthase catalytic subunit